MANQNSKAGIGTYEISGGSVNKNTLGKIRSKISKAVDFAVATSFDAHVMAGYRFLMNYYEPGAKIYMFGFSRGAFTARFLCRMINTIGLLSKGNDEMIPFAYALYQDHEQAKDNLNIDECQDLHKNGDETASLIPIKENIKLCKLHNFKDTFCRRDKIFRSGGMADNHVPVKVYFLGIFDCVNSVAVLETPFGKTPKPVSVAGTAKHIRHAVAVDEFRVKFRAALLHQDHDGDKDNNKGEDIKEVWFPGNHGDVGGGWPAHKLEEEKVQHSWLQRFVASVRDCFSRDNEKNPTTNVAKDHYQMSDIPLSWMIRELELIDDKDVNAIQWSDRLEGFKKHFNEEEALKAPLHNTMSLGQGSCLLKALMWNFMGKHNSVLNSIRGSKNLTFGRICSPLPKIRAPDLGKVGNANLATQHGERPRHPQECARALVTSPSHRG